MAATMNAATFMGKNFLDNQNSFKNSTDLTLKKMFDISEKLVREQEEINNVDTNSLKNSFLETTVIDWWREPLSILQRAFIGPGSEKKW